MCNKLLKGKIDGRLVPFGSIGITIGIIIFCAASYFYNSPATPDHFLGIKEFLLASIYSWFIILGLLTVAIFSGIYIVPLYAIMQHRSEGKYLSRIIAANNVLNALFMVLSSVIVLILFKLNFDLLQIFLLIGFVNIFVFFIIKKIVNQKISGRLKNA